jgi:enoyl-CoA hydratase
VRSQILSEELDERAGERNPMGRGGHSDTPHGGGQPQRDGGYKGGMAEDVLLRVESGIGRITLNRPQTINALTHGMVKAVDAALVRWAADDQVNAVLIDGAGERGLCAGGDIRAVYEDAKAGGVASLAFWADEYRMNARIARYPKPYVAFMDGIVMGGGVGVSAHGSIRVVTERTRLAMPEVGIGLVPDVGGTALLARAPGELGTYLALTASSISAADALHCGLADFFVPAEKLPAVREDLLRGGDPTQAVAARAQNPGPAPLAAQADWINPCFTGDSLAAILDRLDYSDVEEAIAAAKEIRQKSPTAVAVTLAALRRARRLPGLEATLEMEYRLSARSLRDHDLAEGIRAQIIDKDRAPHWKPDDLAKLTDESVSDRFAPTVPLFEIALG